MDIRPTLARLRAFFRRHPHAIAYTTITVVCVIGIYRIETFANDTRSALCAYKDSQERGVGTTKQYLKDVEDGVRKLPDNITTTDLTRSIANQEATLRSLSNLDC